MRELVRTRRLRGALVAALAIVVAEPARADDARKTEAEACFSAAEAAQPLMKQRKLRAAQEKLAICARDACPKAARTDCRAWLDEVLRVQPTVVLVAYEERDGDARSVDDARAAIDGDAAAPLGAAAIALDPGAHVVRFERAGFDPIEQRVVLREEEKGRRVEAIFHLRPTVPPAPTTDTTSSSPSGPARPPAPPAAPAPAPMPVASYLLGGAGTVALVGGIFFEAKGLSDRAHLESTCGAARACAKTDVDAARTRVTIGDVALGASVILLASAVYAYVTREPAQSRAGLRLHVGPLVGGVAAGVEGSLW